jgi:hypothetical protein
VRWSGVFELDAALPSTPFYKGVGHCHLTDVGISLRYVIRFTVAA